MSVLHSKLYQNLHVHNKNKLQPYENELKMADGRNVRPLGTITLPIVLDEQIIWQNLLLQKLIYLLY